MSNSDWPKQKLGALTSRIGDGIHGTPIYVDNSEYSFINGNNLKNGYIQITKDTKKVSVSEFQKYFLEFDNNTLFLSINGTLGSLAKYRGESIILGKSAAYIQCSTINIDYLYYYLQLDSVQEHLWNVATGSTIKNLSLASIRDLEIPTPSIEKQSKIAKVLSIIDAKINCNNQIITQLESVAKLLYDYWFMQFDFPDENGRPFRSSGGVMVFNKELNCEIPYGWESCVLGDHITFKRGISYKSSDIQSTGVPFLNLNSFSLDGEFKPQGTKFFNGKYKNDSLINIGDLIIAITDVTRNADIIGKSFVLGDFFDQKPLISCDVAVVSSEKFGSYYLEQLFNSNQYHSYIKHFASGTLVLHLDLSGVKWYRSIIPPQNLLGRYESTCKAIFKKRSTSLNENIQLKSLRDWLLPMLMNGQVTAS